MRHNDEVRLKSLLKVFIDRSLCFQHQGEDLEQCDGSGGCFLYEWFISMMPLDLIYPFLHIPATQLIELVLVVLDEPMNYLEVG